jgi:ATP-binding cassette, subfamily F, member 2
MSGVRHFVQPTIFFEVALDPRKVRLTMAPSASKQKRLAEKAAKGSAKANGKSTGTETSSTPSGSVNGGSTVGTPLTNTSAATSTEDLTSMAKLQIATDR